MSGLTADERRSLGCTCTRLDDVWHHVRFCPVGAVERIVQQRVNAAVAEALAPIEALAVRAESGADAWGACPHEWARIDEIHAAIRDGRAS